MASQLGVRFWGTRGLVSSPRSETSKYGGNTTCIQIMAEDYVVMVDAGFGASNFGEYLLNGSDKKAGKKTDKKANKKTNKQEIHIFFTHLHWDHIQGLPFFHPIYFPETKLNLYSPLSAQKLKESLDVLFDGSYSPFEGIDSMPAGIQFHQLTGQATLVDKMVVSYQQVNHGTEHNHHGNTWGYRFESGDKSICVITDHEATTTSELNDQVVAFCKDTDILIHDAQYTDSDYDQHVGWGHSTDAMAFSNAQLSGAKQLIMTHHDPSRTDFQLDVISKRYRGQQIKVDFAKEGLEYWTLVAKGKKAG